jgi:hypothetical protein
MGECMYQENAGVALIVEMIESRVRCFGHVEETNISASKEDRLD